MIESLQSPHIARVKALVGSKGVRERRDAGLFVAEGMQCLREALASTPRVKVLYLTAAGQRRIEAASLDITKVDIVDVSDSVMEEMTTTMTPQGILALCELPKAEREFPDISSAIYLSEIQDPGNAGTILRTADAMGIDAVFTSPGSVDMFSPKVVRSTAGSLWHINLFEEVTFEKLQERYASAHFIALSGGGSTSLEDIDCSKSTIAIFGNEARGLETKILSQVEAVYIPMKGRAESLNLSAAAAIVMYHMAQK